MSDNEINIAIAEACGWKCVEPKPQAKDSPYARWMKGGDFREFRNVPSYATDLNAMHEAERLIDQMPVDSKSLYLDYLALEVEWGGENAAEVRFTKDYNSVRSTARQRAEAFLKTIGKWKP